MAIMLRRKEQPPSVLARATDWDPFSQMRELMSWDPLEALSRRLLPRVPEATFMPAFDVKETPEAFEFRADVPGVKEKDLDITLTEDRLTIGGRRETETEHKDDRLYSCERSFGMFARAFTLPRGIDPEHVQAELNGGVLTVVVPKLPEAQAKKVSVKATEKAKA